MRIFIPTPGKSVRLRADWSVTLARGPINEAVRQTVFRANPELRQTIGVQETRINDEITELETSLVAGLAAPGTTDRVAFLRAQLAQTDNVTLHLPARSVLRFIRIELSSRLAAPWARLAITWSPYPGLESGNGIMDVSLDDLNRLDIDVLEGP